MLNRLSGDGTVEIHCDDQAATTTTTARESDDPSLTAAGQESVEQAVVQ